MYQHIEIAYDHEQNSFLHSMYDVLSLHAPMQAASNANQLAINAYLCNANMLERQ